MLEEIGNVRQIENEGFRRWFTDADHDLIVWFDSEGDEIAGFQLCYDKATNERAITWFRTGGFTHTRVDSGEPSMGGPKQTPILVSDGLFDHGAVAQRFLSKAEHIEGEVRDFIYQKLLKYPEP